jgi:hypothetical protein
MFYNTTLSKNLVDIDFGIPGAAKKEVSLYVFQSELFREVVDDEIVVHVLLAGVDVYRDEAAFGECVDADMAFGDDDDTSPAARVLEVVAIRVEDHGLAHLMHPKELWKLVEAFVYDVAAIEQGKVAVVAVDSEVFAEMF